MTALDQLAFILGSWRVEGHMHGTLIRGSAQAERVLGGQAILYRELVDGYEDLCLYRLDAVGELEVHHFSEDGAHRHAVHAMDDGSGLHWVPHTVHGPVVRLLRQADGFQIQVAHRDQPEPDVQLSFRR